jgi:hypothetical protein
MAQRSVNYLLAVEKSLRERLAQLTDLRNQVSKRSVYDTHKEEPLYDVKNVDKKITKINKALFELNHKIKDSNAKTQVDVDLDYEILVSELD